MKKRFALPVIAVTGILLLAGCPNGTTSTTFSVDAAENGFSGTLAISDIGKVSISLESLTMIYANAVMAEVLQWDYDNRRFSTTVSNTNGLDTSTVKHGGQ